MLVRLIATLLLSCCDDEDERRQAVLSGDCQGCVLLQCEQMAEAMVGAMVEGGHGIQASEVIARGCELYVPRGQGNHWPGGIV